MTVDYRPSTFLERGIVVPFTTPALDKARVRQSEFSKCDVVAPWFSEGDSAYVIPLPALPSLVTLTAHDRYLCSTLGSLEFVSPIEIRKAVFDAAMTGLDGPETAEGAERALNQEANERLYITLLFLLNILGKRDVSARDEVLRKLSTLSNSDALRQMLSVRLEQLGLSPTVLFDQLEKLSATMVPVGLAAQPGRLRRLHKGYLDFLTSVKDWLGTAPPELAGSGRLISVTAELTGELVRESFDYIDMLLDDISEILTERTDMAGRLRVAVHRVAWLLDGWADIISLWDTVDTGEDRAAVVQSILRILPILPVECQAPWVTAKLESAKPRMMTRGMVRPMVDWSTGEIDVELLQRVRSAQTKARVAGR